MKKNTITLLLFSFFVATTLLAQSNVLVFTNVNILPMDKKEVLKNQTIIVTDGMITTIRPNEKAKAKIPKNAQIIDGKGNYLLPGLSDMHAHFPGENGEKFDTEKYLALQLANGVTTVRAMRDEPNLVGLRAKIRSGAMLGPNVYLSAVLPLQKEPTINKIKLETLIEGYKQQGYDQIKYLAGGTDEQLKDISSICQKNGIRFVGHAPKYIVIL
jgi:cytosine/adenosine deaminase-related metal-dependent hydrolase